MGRERGEGEREEQVEGGGGDLRRGGVRRMVEGKQSRGRGKGVREIYRFPTKVGSVPLPCTLSQGR